MNEIVPWISLIVSGLAICVSGVSYAHHLWCWASIENDIDRGNRPLEVKLHQHDLELELLTAYESRRHARPTLRIAGTTDAPDAVA